MWPAASWPDRGVLALSSLALHAESRWLVEGSHEDPPWATTGSTCRCCLAACCGAPRESDLGSSGKALQQRVNLDG